MNFNSLQYLLFLPTAVLLYYICPKKARNYLLLALSYYFYMCWQPTYALLILFSTAATYVCARLIKKFPTQKKIFLAGCLIINLAVLFFFKYFNFVGGLINSGLTAAGLAIEIPRLNLLLPVGISFYTFQAIGYTIDVYRGDLAPEKNFFVYALFVSFFPQLVAGPIERATNLLPQFHTDHKFDFDRTKAGITLIVIGMFKKIVLADRLAEIVNQAYGHVQTYSPARLALATAAFAFQIYCDFSAYSDIARGTAQILGFDLMENFNAPYLADSIPDFWRRWHMSLTTWFRDYIYFPLGGSRCAKWRHCLNLLIVFLISGMWHGAALTFIVWGAINGLYQIIHTLTNPLRKRYSEGKLYKSIFGRIIRIIFTFILECIAWVFFRAQSISDALSILERIFIYPFTNFGASYPGNFFNIPNSMWAALIGTLVFLSLLAIFKKRLKTMRYGHYAVWFVLIVIILIFGIYGSGYDPQDFVYFQF